MTSQIITIDGPAASGKGTLARRLAHHLNYFYLDTGKIYRLVGLEAYNLGIIPEDNTDAIAKIAEHFARDFDLDMLNNPELKSDVAGQMASRCSQFPDVRQAVLDLQRNLAQYPPNALKGTVLDGRDCGTVICPAAPHKFYVTANQDIRAKRRHAELLSMGEDISFETVLAEMKTRDDRDMNRATVPLKPAKDAIIVDTSDMSADDAFQFVLENLD